MANPFLPLWEYIPDGEPRVFGDRVYLYGSHDRAGSEQFCDYKLMVWSAPLSDLQHWTCHGVSFSTRDTDGHKADTDWTDRELYAPDVVEKDGKYYLYAYILGSQGCVGVSVHPEGPFTLLSRYVYDAADAGDAGVFNDPGVLVDADGRTYLYYGFERSHFGELESDMFTIKRGSYRADLIPQGTAPDDFYEASSPRKIGGRYYLIYSPRNGCDLNYAISDRPDGGFVRMGTIIRNSGDYPGGNNHGSLCCLNGQWYIFYHRMTNNTITSRRACAERVAILPDGTIPQVEMTSLGFADALDPYEVTPADIACVLKGGCFVTERDVFTRCVTNIKGGCVLGYKYFDFGADHSMSEMTCSFRVKSSGMRAEVHILLDSEDGEELGICLTGTQDGVYETKIRPVTGRHSLFFRIENPCRGWSAGMFQDRQLLELEAFVMTR